MNRICFYGNPEFLPENPDIIIEFPSNLNYSFRLLHPFLNGRSPVRSYKEVIRYLNGVKTRMKIAILNFDEVSKFGLRIWCKIFEEVRNPLVSFYISVSDPFKIVSKCENLLDLFKFVPVKRKVKFYRGDPVKERFSKKFISKDLSPVFLVFLAYLMVINGISGKFNHSHLLLASFILFSLWFFFRGSSIVANI